METARLQVAGVIKGPPGENGKTPYIGENGNWYIGDNDTGKPSRGENGNDYEHSEEFAQLAAQVREDKESVDKTTQDFNLAAQQALADVNNAGQAQTERVQTAGTTAVENIKTAQNTATRAVETTKTEAVKAVETEGTTQTGKVTDEGAKQVQAIQSTGTAETKKVTDEGTKQVTLVKTEGEKHLASVQQAAQEIIADREQIAKNKTDIVDLRQHKADAIVETASGTLLNVKDSANAFFEDFSMSGKTTQDGTPTPDAPVPIVNAGEDESIEIKVTGKNLIPFPYPLLGGVGAKGTINGITWEILKDRGVKIAGKATDNVYINLLLNHELQDKKRFAYSKDLVSDPSNGKIFSVPHIGNVINNIYYPQVEKGTVATAYEPYKEPQTLTLQLDRPLTKWDRLEKREGVWGIVRQGETKVLKAAPEEEWAVWEDKQNAFFIVNDKIIKEGLCSHFEAKGSLEIGKETGIYLSETVHLIVTGMNINSLENWKTWLQANPITVVYKTAEETWEPLPEEMQLALNALRTNYPTTVVSNSEDTEMQLTYVADTKNFILGIAESFAQKQLETSALLLERTI